MNAVLTLVNFEFSYERETVNGWKLTVPEFSLTAGQIAVISGDNMSGKSTFLNIAAGLIPIENCAGTVVAGATDGPSQDELARGSIILSTDDNMFPELSVRDNIIIANHEVSHRVVQERLPSARSLLRDSGILGDDVLERSLGALSSGGRSLVKLARAYTSDCPLIVVDEISSFLDDARAEYFIAAAIRLVQESKAMIIVSHSHRDRQQLLSYPQAMAFHISRAGNLSEMRRQET